MKFVTIDNFLTRKQATLVGNNIVAVAIASSSEVDLVTVGSHRLAPMSIVPFDSNVVPVRGERIGQLPDGTTAGSVGSKLVLQLYECGDALVPPGPRSPIVVATGFVAPPAAILSAAPVLRLPFSGRKQATFKVGWDNAGFPPDLPSAPSVMVRGVSYNTFALQNTIGGAGPWDGAAQDAIVVDDSVIGPIIAATSAPDGAGQATVFHIGGGGDNQECFDELELYVYGGTVGVFCVGEASGERG